MFMMKNSKGDKDAMLTFAFGGFIITAMALIASFLGKVTFQNFEVIFKNPDSTIVVAFLGATLLAYVNRRNTKDKHSQELEMKKLDLLVGAIDESKPLEK